MYKSCFDGILSCLNGSSLLSSCFYPPVQSDSGHKTLAKARAEIKSRNYDAFCTNDPRKSKKQMNLVLF
ncbi:MAG: hypothetical protein EBT55_01045 [Proteobacteria bacterium]|nr:hypothetical protein [Pseudomonadota bacterium]